MEPTKVGQRIRITEARDYMLNGLTGIILGFTDRLSDSPIAVVRLDKPYRDKHEIKLHTYKLRVIGIENYGEEDDV